MNFKVYVFISSVIFAVIYGFAGQALVGSWEVGELVLVVAVLGVAIESLLMNRKDKPMGGKTGGTRNGEEFEGNYRGEWNAGERLGR